MCTIALIHQTVDMFKQKFCFCYRLIEAFLRVKQKRKKCVLSKTEKRNTIVNWFRGREIQLTILIT